MKPMKSFLWKTLGILLSLALVFSFSPAVMAADDYPTKPVRMIVPFPPGGSNDIVGRMVAAKLTDRLGQQVIVENISGAGGSVGTERASKAAPDGYTLAIISAAYAINTSLYKLPYDPYKDFSPVSLLGKGPNVLVVKAGSPVKSVKDLIAMIKAKPGELTCGGAGVGSFQHMGAELFKHMTGANYMIVQYKGGGPSITDLLGGHLYFTLPSLAMVTSHINSGKLIALGTGGSKRYSLMPDVPTIAEAGVPGYDSTNWWGIQAPAGTPRPIIERLNKELKVILSQDETKQMFLKQGAEAEWMGVDEFVSYIKAETEKWAKVVKAAGIKVEKK